MRAGPGGAAVGKVHNANKAEPVSCGELEAKGRARVDLNYAKPFRLEHGRGSRVRVADRGALGCAFGVCRGTIRAAMRPPKAKELLITVCTGWRRLPTVA